MARERDTLVVGRVIGDVVDPFYRSIPLSVSYGSKEVNMNGCELKPSVVVNQPRVSVGGNDLRTFYTLVMVDPDAPNPSDAHHREYLHWLVTDIPATTNATFGNEVVCYESPRSESIGLFSFCSNNLGGKPSMHHGGVSISTPEILQNFTTSGCLLQQSTTIASAKEELVEEDDRTPLKNE